MDVEQLKMVLEMLGNAGADARSVAIWYIATKAVLGVIAPVASLVFGLFALRTARAIFCGIAEHGEVPRQVASELGLSPGAYWTHSDTDDVLVAIRRLKGGGSL